MGAEHCHFCCFATLRAGTVAMPTLEACEVTLQCEPRLNPCVLTVEPIAAQGTNSPSPAESFAMQEICR